MVALDLAELAMTTSTRSTPSTVKSRFRLQRCVLIDAEKANYPIAWMCRLLGVVPDDPRGGWAYSRGSCGVAGGLLVGGR